MRCMKNKTTHGDKDPNPRIKYNLMPETTRVGVQFGKVTYGALHNQTHVFELLRDIKDLKNVDGVSSDHLVISRLG